METEDSEPGSGAPVARAPRLLSCLGLVNPAKKTYLDPKDLPKVERATLRRILATLAPYRSRVALVVLAVLTASLLNVLPPFFVKRAVDQAIPSGDLRLLLLLCAGMVVGPVLAGLVGVFQKHLTTSTSETLMRDLRVRMFEHFQGLPFSYFVHAKPGEAIAGVISDVQGVGSVVATTLVDVLDGMVVFASTAAVLVYFDWRLALVTLALLPLFVLPTRAVGRERKRMRRAAQARATELVGILDEALSASGILLARVLWVSPACTWKRQHLPSACSGSACPRGARSRRAGTRPPGSRSPTRTGSIDERSYSQAAPPPPGWGGRARGARRSPCAAPRA